MSLLLLQLSLCAAVVIKLTSSQSTYDVTCQDNDVISCGSSRQIVQTLRQLMTVNSQLVTANTQLVNAVSQLQRDVAELKNASSPSPTEGVKGKYCEVVKQPIRHMHGSFYSKCWTTLFHFYIVTQAHRTVCQCERALRRTRLEAFTLAHRTLKRNMSIYTVSQKNRHHITISFYNSVKIEAILIIFGTHNLKTFDIGFCTLV